MREYRELVSDDPAWSMLVAALTPRVEVLPCEPAGARACLEQLQVTTRSPLGAVAHETGGMIVDGGWLRLFGAGHPRLTRTLGGWNARVGVPLGECVLVGDDVIGGVFAINGGALGAARGHVHYFAPDSLAWEDLGRGYGDFLAWVFAGDLALFYRDVRWPGWEREVASIPGDRTLSLYPAPWTAEGKDLSTVSRRAVPAEEIWGMYFGRR